MSWEAVAAALTHSHAAVDRCYGRRARRPDWFGARAAGDRLRESLAEAELHFRLVEMEAWREYHSTTVTSASSLALAWFAHEGLLLDEAVMGLGPDGDDPPWLVGPAPAWPLRWAKRNRRGVHRNLFAPGAREHFLHAGLVLRRWGEPSGALGIRLSEHGLEFAIRSAGVRLRTIGDFAVVVVEAEVPEAMRASMLGRPIGALIDHPALRDPSLLVEEVGDLEQERSLVPGAWRMLVRAPREPWRLPWARGRS